MPDDDQGWWSRERVLVLTLLAATGLAFYVCYRLLLPFLPSLTWAIALAVVAHPLHEWISARIRNENVAAGLAVFVVALIIVAPTIYVSQRLAREALGSLESVRTAIETGSWRAAVDADPRLGYALAWLEENVDLRAEVERYVSDLTPRVGSVVTGSLWMVAELMITLFALFFFFRDRRAALRAVRSLVPLSERETDEIVTRVADTIHATVFGTLGVALIQGALGGLMFWWLGLPAPILWGAAMAMLAVVPMLGAFMVWGPAALLLALGGSWGKATILAAWGLLVVSLVDNMLYPTLVGRRLRLHVLPVFFAILGGLALFGASGLVLGPVALAVTLALVDIWRRRTAHGRVAEAGVSEQKISHG
jgi:predicted PurR-regulated permease PerM